MSTWTKEDQMPNQHSLRDAPPPVAFANLVRQKTVLLTTYRRDGSPVPTPVSIAVDGNHAFVRTYEKAGKVRRIRRNPHVGIGPCTSRGKPTGPATQAVARRLSGEEAKAAARALAHKYPVLQGILVPLSHRVLRFRTGRTVHYELVAEAPVSPPSAG
jgi:PPOX class probable F420-dependent enzyme